jgi:hypothetical protein
MSTQNTPKWNFQADYLQACNCDYGCPCEFSAPPTAGYCEAAGIWQIRKGRCGEIPLDGLSVAFAAHWPKAIHLGGGTVCVILDERANPNQRDALTNIVAGKYGGIPYEILATTFTTMLDPVVAKFDVNLAGHESSARVGNYLALGFEPVKNVVTGDPEFVRIETKPDLSLKAPKSFPHGKCRFRLIH